MFVLTKEAVDWVRENGIHHFWNHEKVQEICELRRTGMTYKQISEEVNFPIDQVRKCVRKVQRLYKMHCRKNGKWGE